MAAGDVWEVTENDCSDLYYLDTGMYDTESYGAAYVLDAERPAIVETGIGTNYEFILDALDELEIDRADVEVIAPTHVHLDHAGGAGFLAEACPNADVYVHEIGARHLVDPSRLVAGTKHAVGEQWKYYVEPKPVPEERVHELADGDVVDLGDHALEVHHAPGHAPHQVVFHDPANDAVFTGDAAGIWVPDPGFVTETSPPTDFDLEQCLADVETIRGLEPETLLFTHFGPNFDPEDALTSYEDVLSNWVATVEAAREEYGDDEAAIEHLIEQSEMADVWGERKARAEVVLNTRGVLHYLDHRAD